MAKPENRLRGSYLNILALPMTAESVVQGQNWYEEANKIAYTVGRLAGYRRQVDCVKVGAGIISDLSPTIEWGQNVNIAILLVTSKGEVKQTYQRQHDKAVAIMNGADPEKVLGTRATKTKAFYRAIVDPYNDYSEPVIDRHAVAVYMGRAVSERELRALESTKVYNRIAKAYMRASKAIRINHHMLQAQTWTQWRTSKGVDRQGRQLSIE